MNPVNANPSQLIEGASASSELFATNARLMLLSFFVLFVVFVHRQVLRLMIFARQLNL
jgi:hypothetical protein